MLECQRQPYLGLRNMAEDNLGGTPLSQGLCATILWANVSEASKGSFFDHLTMLRPGFPAQGRSQKPSSLLVLLAVNWKEQGGQLNSSREVIQNSPKPPAEDQAGQNGQPAEAHKLAHSTFTQTKQKARAVQGQKISPGRGS